MGLILRGPHDSLPIGATISGTRLTIEQMDSNFIFLQGLIDNSTTVSNTDAINLINAGQVIPNSSYLISGANPYLYGTTSIFTNGQVGTDVIINGLDSSHFSTNGYGKFYNPNYASYSIWDYTGGTEYSVNDIVIFGGQVWKSLTGEVGTTSGGSDGFDSNSYVNLDNTNWQVLPYNTSYYNVVWDEIEYDIQADYIASRYEALNNNLVRHSTQDFWFYCGISPIQGFRWGSVGGFGQPNTVINCTVIDSYFGCLNFVSGYISDVELTNYSSIYNLYIENESEFYGIKLSNNSNMNSLDINNGQFSNVTLDNYSNMNNFNLNNDSSIQYVNLQNYSSINYFTLHDEDCYINYINLNNNSNINNFDLYDASYIRYIDLTNNSSVNYFSLSDVESDDGSYLQYVNITNYSSLSHFYLYNTSYIQHVVINNNSIITQLYLCSNSGSNANLSYITVENNSSIINDDDAFIYLEDGSYIGNLKLDNYSTFVGEIRLIGGSYINVLSLNNGNFGGSFGDFGSTVYLTDTANILNISVTDGLITGLSFTNSSINNLTMDNSYFGGVQADNNSYLTEINLMNACFNNNNNYVAQSVEFDDSTDWIYLNNGSYMNDISIENSLITGYISLDNGSYWQAVKLTNFSTITGGSNGNGDTVNDEDPYNYQIVLDNSNIINVSLNNNSILGLGFISLTSSAMYNIEMDNFSYMTGYLTLDTSAIGHLTMNNHSKFGRGNSDSDNYSGSIQLFEGSSFEYITINNNAIIDGPISASASILSNVILQGTINTGLSNIGTPYYELYEEWNEINLGVDKIIFGNGLYLNDSTMTNIQVSNGSCMKGMYNNTEGDPQYNNYILSGSMSNILVDNGSYMSSIYLQDGSFLQNIEVTNSSMFIGIVAILNSFISYTNVNNYSYFGDFIWLFGESYITFIDVDNNSQLYGDDFGNGDINLSASEGEGPASGGSYLQNVSIKNNSSITGLNFDLSGDGGSYFENITLNNNSYIYNINLYNNSSFQTVNIDNKSGIDSVYLCDDSGANAFLGNIRLNNNSYITNDDNNIYIEDGSYIKNLVLESSSILSGYIEMYNNSYIDGLKLENNSSFGYGTYFEASSYLTNVTINNDSDIESFYLDNSYADYININNNSEIHDENYINSYLFNIELTNGSEIHDNELTNSSVGQIDLNSSEIYDNTLTNSSEFGALTLNDSDIYNIHSDDSGLGDIQMNDSSIYNNTLSAGSNLSDLVLNVSEIHGSTLENSSVVYSQLYDGTIHNATMNSSNVINCMFRSSMLDTATFTSSVMDNVEIINDSSITSCFFINEGLHKSSLMSSIITTTILNGYGISYLYMRDSVFSAYSSTASITNLDMIGSTFHFNNDSAYVVPNYTRADTNTIKYQFSKTFDGSTGNGEIGAISIPKMLIPWNGTGWYIERVIVDNSNTGATLSIAGTYSYMNVGNTTDSDTGLDDSKGDVMSMVDRITVSDISNGGADGMKTNSIGYIVMNVEGSSITNGTIFVEITLKNTNYGTNNG